MNKPSISVVIPAYNEEKTVESVAKDALRALSELCNDYEVVFVDDGSSDATGKIIDSLAKENRFVRSIHHQKNQGFTGVIKTSFQSAKKDLIFLAPADGQFDFGELRKFVKAIKDYDVVLGYRKEKEENLVRKINSIAFHLISRIVLGIKFKEISSVSLWRRKVIKSIKVESEDRSAMYLPEIIYKALNKGYKFTQVSHIWRKRQRGKAKGANPLMIAKTFLAMAKFWVEIHFSNKLN
jgi:glycosyltransferase involved in cell wall biosynthesis